MKSCLLSLAMILLLVLTGCDGGGAVGAAQMKAPEVGLTMNAPSGWSVESAVPAMSTQGDSTGMILIEALDDRSFDDYVQELMLANDGQVVASSTRTFNGYNAVVPVIEFPLQGSKALKAYVHKDDTLVEVSFVTPLDEFDQAESALRQAINSITFE